MAALPNIGKVGRFTGAAVAGLGAAAGKTVLNAAGGVAAAVLSQSPITATMVGLLGSGAKYGKKVFDKINASSAKTDANTKKTAKNTGKLVEEAKKSTTNEKLSVRIFSRMLGELKGLRTAIVGSLSRTRRDSVLASMRKFSVPTVGPHSNLAEKKKEGGEGLGLFGTAAAMMLARGLWGVISGGIMGAVTAAFAGGALLKTLGSVVWSVGKKALKVAGIIGIGVAIVEALWEGISDGIESGSVKEGVISALSKFVESISFGLISKEQVEAWVRPVIQTIADAMDSVKKWVLNLIPSLGEPAGPPLASNNLNKNTDQRETEAIERAAESSARANDPNLSPEEREKAQKQTLSEMRKIKGAKTQRMGYLKAAASGGLEAMLAPSLVRTLNRQENKLPNGEPVPMGPQDERNIGHLDALKAAMEFYSSQGLLDLKNPLHAKMQSFFVEKNRGVITKLPHRDRETTMQSMIKEMNEIFRNGGKKAIDDYIKEEENRFDLQMEALKEVAIKQGLTEETITRMLSNSPPFLMTIRDAILGTHTGPTLFSEMVDILDDIYDALVESTRLFSGRADWDPRAITLGNSSVSETTGVPTAPEMRRIVRSGGNASQIPMETGPGVRGMLDYIGKLESQGNYNALVYGNGTPKENKDLTGMTISQVMDYQKGMKGRGHESSAVGKYQFIRGTLAGVVKQAGLDPETTKFTPEIQDKLATMLMEGRGLNAFLSGKITPEQFANNMAKEWASLPMDNGKSFYAGDKEGNKSGASRGSFMAQVQKTRASASGLPGTTIGPDNKGGEHLIEQARKLEALSKNVRSEKDEAIPSQPPIVINPPVKEPIAQVGSPRNVAGRNTLPVRNTDADFRAWNRDSMLRAMA